jgi:hypothetical protein
MEVNKKSFKEIIQVYNERAMYRHVQDEAMMYEHLCNTMYDKSSKNK